MKKIEPKVHLWAAVAYLVIMIFGTLIIGLCCSGNPRWNIGD